MTRVRSFVLGALTGALLVVPARADDPPRKLTAEERTELEAKWKELDAAAVKAFQAGRYADALKAAEPALELARRLYAAIEFPDGHENLATSLNHVGVLYKKQGRGADAERLYKEALDLQKRLYKGDHAELASGLDNLAALYLSQGKYVLAEPLFRDALAMRKRLFTGDHPDVATSLEFLGDLHKAQGRLTDAEPLYRAAVDMNTRLFKGDHADLSGSLDNLAGLLKAQGRLADAEPVQRSALEMTRRVFKGDHPAVSRSLTNLAALYKDQGKFSEAEPLYREALDMAKRLSKGDSPAVATGLNNLGFLYYAQGNMSAAESFSRDALDMRKRLYKGDHSDVATSSSNLAAILRARGKLEEAAPFYRAALDMRKRLFKGDHPAVAHSLNNIAFLYLAQGKLDDAEGSARAALDMNKRLYNGDHLDVARALNNLAGVYRSRADYERAEPLYHDSREMYQRLVQSYAQRGEEGAALTLIASLPNALDNLLSSARAAKFDPERVYPELWSAKGMVARVYEQRYLSARAAIDPTAAGLLVQLATARRRRAELLLAPQLKDPDSRAARERALDGLKHSIAKHSSDLEPLLPAMARAEALAATAPSELQKWLPAGAAVVDYLRYSFVEQDRDVPGEAGQKRTPSYLAFVVTRNKIAWVDLGPAATVEAAVTEWRGALTEGKEIPAAVPARAREVVWAKVRAELPPGTGTVYVCPDRALCAVPFAALPGDKPGTVVLEDFALATIPHAPFLLDKLRPQDAVKNPPPVGTPSGALVVGGVKYDAEPAPPAANRTGGEPLLTPGQKLRWGFLDNTLGEAAGVAGAAERKKLVTTRLEGDKATASAVLAALPRARVAHLATHGFFADPSFRGLFDLDENDYAQRGGERIGRAANSPLVMTGLVLAGANNPNTPGRGIVTGEALIDLDLSGLQLAVLSACETGVGDVAGGEGTFGLQRALHYAGTRDVAASLWKVPDRSTAALMGLFYRNLWDKNLTPIEALRQAQLELYRHPDKIPELAKGFRGKFEIVSETGDVQIKPAKDGTAHPLLWAGFTLSGPGR
jgi:CHAT domain-containing protein/tetratricopeptide (TPR) repeat protein